MPNFVLGRYRLEVATHFGPRITGLRLEGSGEVLAELAPEVAIEHANGLYHFHGGHRLWVSPEEPAFTYANDDQDCSVEGGDASIKLSSGVDEAGFTKEIEVSLDGDGLLVSHVVTREPGAVEGMAAWAITQLPLDGIALLPLGGPDTRPLPNRNLVLWPDTSLVDDRIRITKRGVEMAALPGSPMKIGAGPDRPPLGYLRNGQLFIKRFVSASEGEVPDFGAGNQVYVGQGFCELEIVGGMSTGTVATETERWSIQGCESLDMAWSLLTGETAG